MLNPQIENPKPSVDSFELPCGYLDAEGNLHTTVTVTEMTGEEEEILAARNMPVMKKLNTILANCTQSIGDIRDPKQIEGIIKDLTQGDRVFLLFAIRRVSLGDSFPLSSQCPKCEYESRVTIDLSELEVKKMKDPKIRSYELVLPKSKKKVSMKVLNGHGEEKISKASTAGKDIITMAILARMDGIDGRTASPQTLKELSLSDRNFIRDEWQEHEGGIDTGVEITCGQCELTYETDVDMASTGFFNPLAVAKAWRSKSSH